MSLQLINQYQAKLERLIAYGGSRNETSVRAAFQDLLDRYAAAKNLALVTELEYKTRLGTTVRPDGTLKNAVRQDVGYWESKDERDDLDAEIVLKFAKGYPDLNILFDDTQQVVLYQNGLEVGRAAMSDARLLNTLLEQFVGFETPFVRTFREAIGHFQDDLPDLLEHLRGAIAAQAAENAAFREKQGRLLELVQKAINPHLTVADVREMVIQHLLTEEIFTSVFNDAQFHRENNVARELAAVTETFFTGSLRRDTLTRIRPYYAVIQQAAVNIADHHEKQQFLKIIYETFYQAYNPASADRLGIVYTPNEIVRFMVEAADFLTEKHFGKLLGDRGVNILDPATGTGTFITEIIEYLPKAQLQHKYAHELFCNEVALLPYYTANLNIEYTYQQKMGHYAEFENIAFVDTLDNLNYVGATGQFGMFELTAENLERIRRQNEQQISVIIGNPPYNANQQNANRNNKNREYPRLDKRIEGTYVKNSTAQKTSSYDMYARFLRWASDRLGEQGVIAFVINRSFVAKRAYDGLRKTLKAEFDEVYVVDLKGDSRVLGEEAKRQGANVFPVRVGVAICLLVRKNKNANCRIFYNTVKDYASSADKLDYIRSNSFGSMDFYHVVPDKLENWIDVTENEWDDLIPIAKKKDKGTLQKQTIFDLSAPGVSTQRDDWVFGRSKSDIESKIKYFIDAYNASVEQVRKVNLEEVTEHLDWSIKWSDGLIDKLSKRRKLLYDDSCVTKLLYRPFTLVTYYSEKNLSDRLTDNHFEIFGQELDRANEVICVTMNSQVSFVVQMSKYIPSYDAGSRGGTQCLPLYRYDKLGNRLENITDWGLKQFRTHYGDESISKKDIFHYVYGVLHNPAYRKKYELNLRREFPRIPFYGDFARWAAWGEKLLELHLNFETVEPYPLQRADLSNVKTPKAKLKADKAAGEIILDSQTILSGVPAAAWDYKLGNRSGLEWVLERYKERTPKDKTVAERFNTYRFADYKEDVVVLLGRVCAVSVQTSELVAEMAGADE